MNNIKELLDEKTIKFLLVGIINTVVGSGLMFILYNIFAINYWISSAANYIVGSVVSYFLNKYYTFNNTEKSMGQVLRFTVNILLCYLIAYGAAKPIVLYILKEFSKKIRENVAMLVGMVLFVIFNYLGQRIFVFGKNGNR